MIRDRATSSPHGVAPTVEFNGEIELIPCGADLTGHVDGKVFDFLDLSDAEVRKKLLRTIADKKQEGTLG